MGYMIWETPPSPANTVSQHKPHGPSDAFAGESLMGLPGYAGRDCCVRLGWMGKGEQSCIWLRYELDMGCGCSSLPRVTSVMLELCPSELAKAQSSGAEWEHGAAEEAFPTLHLYPSGPSTMEGLSVPRVAHPELLVPGFPWHVCSLCIKHTHQKGTQAHFCGSV